AVAFTCADATECTATNAAGAPLANGALLDTSTVGMSYITVTAKDATTTTQQQALYFVSEDGNTDPGGSTPPTLTLTLGQPTAFAPFIPGVPRDYTATLAVQVLSTAGDGTLTVSDASATRTGHLVNGDYFLANALQAAGNKPVGDGPAP